MKKNKILGIIITLGILAAIVMALQKFGEPSALYLRGNVKIAENVKAFVGEPKALFITVFDANAQGGRPLAVYHQRFSGAVTNDQFSFVLTPETLQIMGQRAMGEGGPTLPELLFVKARIDQDGLGGPDQSGDLVGFLENVALGSDGVELVVNTRIN